MENSSLNPYQRVWYLEEVWSIQRSADNRIAVKPVYSAIPARADLLEEKKEGSGVLKRQLQIEKMGRNTGRGPSYKIVY